MDGMTSGRIKDVYVIRDSEKPGVKAFWMRVGRAFVNHDGSLNVYLDAIPAHGKRSCRLLTLSTRSHELRLRGNGNW